MLWVPPAELLKENPPHRNSGLAPGRGCVCVLLVLGVIHPAQQDQIFRHQLSLSFSLLIMTTRTHLWLFHNLCPQTGTSNCSECFTPELGLNWDPGITG